MRSFPFGCCIAVEDRQADSFSEQGYQERLFTTASERSYGDVGMLRLSRSHICMRQSWVGIGAFGGRMSVVFYFAINTQHSGEQRRIDDGVKGVNKHEVFTCCATALHVIM